MTDPETGGDAVKPKLESLCIVNIGSDARAIDGGSRLMFAPDAARVDKWVADAIGSHARALVDELTQKDAGR